MKNALNAAFAETDNDVAVWADKSDYKDFIRMYVVSDYFKRLPEKERLARIYSMLESHGAKSLIRKISLCIAMTESEYERDFGAGLWLGIEDRAHRPVNNRPKLHRVAGTRKG